ncbi:MAG: GSCFA domain-containing protein [Caulobacter sp.]|nr:GSCFA domain-containing protein [Caulobacter sp.]
MPLVSLSGAEAFANLKANRRSLWPDGRKDQSRLDGVAKVHFKPSFSLTPGEAVFTMGSCFARNIERRFSELGFELPTMALTLPAEERASDTENDLLNKYPPHSILNELRWALDPEAAFPEGGFFNVKKDLWHDPHLAGNVAPAPLERVVERRRMVEEIYRQVPRCRLVVMTLGLTEAWFDKETGYYLNAAPPQAAFKADPDRFRMDVLTVDEILVVLEQIRDLLMRFGHPQMRMMLTVSPVPFKATFTGRDAIIANSYSKSALRAAAEMFVFRHGNVDYVPSYEIVTHTSRASAFIQDNRHITPSVVNEIVDRVVSAYCAGLAGVQPTEDSSRMSPTLLREFLQEGDFASAVGVFGRLEKGQRYQRWGYSEFDYRLSYGKALAKLEGLAEAQAQLSKAVVLNPQDSDAHYNLGLVLAKLQRSIEAEEQIALAVALDPESAEIRLRYARQLVANGKPDEAAAELRIAAEQHPSHRRVRAFLDTVQESLNTQKSESSADAAGETSLLNPATTAS